VLGEVCVYILYIYIYIKILGKSIIDKKNGNYEIIEIEIFTLISVDVMNFTCSLLTVARASNL